MRLYVQGGLGNQLFQLAFADYLLAAGRHVKLDISLLDHPPSGTTPRAFAIGDLLRDEPLVSHPSGVRRVQFVLPVLTRLGLGYVEDFGGDWRRLGKRHTLVREAIGYFQDPQLVEEVWPSLAERFARAPRWMPILTAPVKARVCLHYRLGDYVGSGHHGVTHPSYFEEAVRGFCANGGPREVVVVTDSPALATQLLSGLDTRLGCSVSIADGVSEMADLHCLATSSHVVISNSSFSWWGGYFASKKGATVVAPSPWFVGGDSRLADVPGWRVRARDVVDMSPIDRRVSE